MPPPPPPPARPRRLLAIDPGERRTGVAVSDDLGLYAHPRPAIAHRDEAARLRGIATAVAAEAADELIVGLPLSLSGEDSEQTRRVRDLVRRLRAELPVPVSEWDERLSSVEAGRAVRGRDARRAGVLDSAAAAVVLQAVLDARRLGGRT